jgi:K+-transporting ATPase KdpC subunit
VALLVCLIPTTIGRLLSAIGIAGMDRMIQANVIAMSGRAVEAAGDVDVLLLDKTGTITLGNRQAVAFHPADGVGERDLADAAQLSSLADETPEGRSIVVLAKDKYNIRERDITGLGAQFVPFTAQTRMSGVNLDHRQVRKGAAAAIENYVINLGGQFPGSVKATVDGISKKGGTPLVVSDGRTVLGTIELKDIVKGGIKERFAELRGMGIKTVMITGDNPLTAAAIAAEAGVDDFLAQATPEAKLKLIRDYQAGGRLVAMTGDGTNDAPALAQADVAVAMNTGTQAAKEAGNMVDLDSNPTKLIEVVETGKQLLMTRGALTTFSIANDVSKYFAIIPVMFVATYPQLKALNIMGLKPETAVLSALIFNALIIVALIPIALRGVKYRPRPAMRTMQTNEQTITEAPRTGLGGILRATIGAFVVLTVITGVIYPLAITAIAKLGFANQAGGSLIDKDGKPTEDETKAVGSTLIGQVFDQPGYFWSRPSATDFTGSSSISLGYNAAQSSGSNTGPMAMADTVKGRVDVLAAADKDAGVTNAAAGVPVDLVTASGSGLDPEESVAAALYQVGRVAKMRHVTTDALEGLVKANTHGPMLGVLGEQTVNVLALNMALDKLAPMPAASTVAAAASAAAKEK